MATARTRLGPTMAGNPKALTTLQLLARSQGDVARFQLGFTDAILVSHPDLVKELLVTQHRNFAKGRALEAAKRALGEGLLTSEGELHRRQRRLMQPIFHHERVAGYATAMVDHADRMATRWRDGQVVDANAEMMRLTLAIVGQTLFDADLEGEAQAIGRALTTTLQSFNRFASPFAPLYEILPLPSTVRARRALAVLDGVIERMIAERRANPDWHHDLLALLLAAQDDEEGTGGMSDKQVRDEAITIFLAGHETTAQALTWTWWLLSQNPRVEAALHQELDAALAGRAPEPSDVARLPFTRKVVAESMRLFPPAWVLGRRALVDTELGGVRVPQGSIVATSQWVVHRDERWWPEPLRFDPDRPAPPHRYAYFPFGGGPRVCIGEGFAWTEAVLLLATLAQRWRLVAPPDAREPTLQPLITLRPKEPMTMRLEARLPRRA